MPFRKIPPKCINPSKLNDQKSVLNGYRPLVVLSTKSRYVGRWKDNKKSGFGKEYFANNTLYEGYFKDHKRDGFGTLRKLMPNGIFEIVYDGDWKNNLKHGDGRRYYAVGEYIGKWEYGVRCGFGIMWYHDHNSAYMGEWKDDKYHGIGVLFEVNGNRYEGNFQNGLKHGEGTYYHLHSGQVQKGIWTNNCCNTSIMQDEFRNQVLQPTEYPVTPSHLLAPNLLVRKQFRNHLAANRGVLRESF